MNFNVTWLLAVHEPRNASFVKKTSSWEHLRIMRWFARWNRLRNSILMIILCKIKTFQKCKKNKIRNNNLIIINLNIMSLRRNRISEKWPTLRCPCLWISNYLTNLSKARRLVKFLKKRIKFKARNNPFCNKKKAQSSNKKTNLILKIFSRANNKNKNKRFFLNISFDIKEFLKKEKMQDMN